MCRVLSLISVPIKVLHLLIILFTRGEVVTARDKIRADRVINVSAFSRIIIMRDFSCALLFRQVFREYGCIIVFARW